MFPNSMHLQVASWRRLALLVRRVFRVNTLFINIGEITWSKTTETKKYSGGLKQDCG